MISLSARCWCSLSRRSIQVPAPPTAWPPLSLSPAVSRQPRHCRHYWAKPRPHCQVRGDLFALVKKLELVLDKLPHESIFWHKYSSLSQNLTYIKSFHIVPPTSKSSLRLFVSVLRVRPRWLSLPMSGDLTERESFFTVGLIHLYWYLWC